MVLFLLDITLAEVELCLIQLNKKRGQSPPLFYLDDADTMRTSRLILATVEAATS